MNPAMWIMLAGTAAQMYGAKQQRDERRRVLNNSLERTAGTQKQTQALIQDEAKEFAPEARQQSMQAAEDAAFTRTQQDLAGAGAGETAAMPGRVSQDYLDTRAERTAQEGDRLSAIAREAARTRAPGLLMTREGLRRADMQSRVGSMLGSDANLARASGADADGVGTPVIGQLGQLATAAGAAYGAYGGGASNSSQYAMPSGAQLGATTGSTALTPVQRNYLNGGARIRIGG